MPDNINHWQVFEDDEQIDDFLQSRNEFTRLRPSLEHDEDISSEKQANKIEFSSTADINLITHPCKEEIFEDIDQRDLEVLQCKDDTLPRGLAPLEELFDFNDVVKNHEIEFTKNDVE